MCSSPAVQQSDSAIHPRLIQSMCKMCCLKVDWLQSAWLYPHWKHACYLPAIVNNRCAWLLKTGKKRKVSMWVTLPSMTLSCHANKNTEALIITVLVSKQTRSHLLQTTRGNTHRGIICKGLDDVQKRSFVSETHLNIYQGNRAEQSQHTSTSGRRLTKCMTS